MTRQVSPPPLPPQPRFMGKKMAADCITNKEIARFWRQKQIKEEEHLLAAIKAAARVRARNLSEECYKRFEESLKQEDDDIKEPEITSVNNIKCYEKRKGEVQVGIKDWWTKSMYAYLNQPALVSTDFPKRRVSSYAPNCFSFKHYVPLHPTCLGVF